MKRLFTCLLVVLVSITQAQSRYVVQFRNKAGTPYSLNTPAQYLSQRAIDRRTRYNITIDSTDLPVTLRYLDSVRLAGTVTVLNVSRWLNSVSIQTTDAAALSKIAGLPFVQSLLPIAARTTKGYGKTGPAEDNQQTAKTTKTENTTADYFDYGQAFAQVHIHNGEFLHNIGLRGQGMIIGILDGGFYHYTSLRSFDSANAAGQVLGTYDFVARKQSVAEENDHGMQCFSTIAANVPGQFTGTAPKASFYLFRSEDVASEYPVEEHNWVCAAERLDSAGGDLISTSLGYTTFDDASFNHSYQDMNGNVTVAARGADLAAKKGILVVTAMGNDGANSWHYLSTSADGDSVMAVGSVSRTGVVAGSSSFGPSYDNQVKPDVAAVGVAATVQSPNNTIGINSGTSFATPIMAGLAACLWQGFKEANNMRIINALRQAGSNFTSPDNRTGYGIPDVKKAVISLLKDFSTASIAATPCKNTVSFTSKDLSSMKYEIERLAPGETVFVKIGERQGTGGAFASQSYQFADSLSNGQIGAFSYRIRQIMDTAAATLTADYMDTATVTASCVATVVNPVLPTVEEVTLAPNPTSEKLTLKVTTPYPVQALLIRITDVKGAVVFVTHNTKAAGTASFVIPSYQLARGKYFVSLYNGDKLMITKELLKL